MSVLNDKLLLEIGDLLATHYEELHPRAQPGPETAFGRYLRTTRRWRGLTIPELAIQSGVAESEILAYEHGIIPQPNIQSASLCKLAKTLGEDLTNFTLLLGSPSKPPATTANSSSWPAPPGHRFWLELISARAGKLPYYTPVLAAALGLLIWLIPASTIQLRAPLATTAPSAAALVVPTSAAAHPAPTEPNTWRYANLALTAAQQNEPAAVEPVLAIQRIDPRLLLALKDLLLNPSLANTLTSTTLAPLVQATPADAFVQSVGSAVTELMVQPPPFTHTVEVGENLSCIASKYYGQVDYYPIICLSNFGEAQCSTPLHPKSTIVVPLLADLDQAQQQTLRQLSPTVVTGFKTLSREALMRNQSKRLRGIDYFCQDDDYQNYGEQLVLAGLIEDPAHRIPGWSATKG